MNLLEGIGCSGLGWIGLQRPCPAGEGHEPRYPPLAARGLQAQPQPI